MKCTEYRLSKSQPVCARADPPVLSECAENCENSENPEGTEFRTGIQSHAVKFRGPLWRFEVTNESMAYSRYHSRRVEITGAELKEPRGSVLRVNLRRNAPMECQACGCEYRAH